MTNEYIAGFFDGEGCIHAYIHNGYDGIRVTISQKRADILEAIHLHLNGVGKVVPHVRGVWLLQINAAEDIIGFLTAIEPYLILRRAEAQIAIEIAKTMNSRGKRPVEGALEVREGLIEKLKQASNQRRLM